MRKFVGNPKYTGREVLLTIAVMYNNKWDDMYNHIKEKRLISDEQFEHAKTMYSGKVMTIIDPDYPEVLKSVYKPPFVIFFDRKDQLKNLDFSSPEIIKTYLLGGK